MNKETIAQLREMTGAGIMDCKKALEATGGNIELAVTELRKKSIITAENKASRSTKEGRVFIRQTTASIGMIQIECETDFVAKSGVFSDFADVIFNTLLDNSLSMEEYIAVNEAARTSLVAKTGENILDSRNCFMLKDALIGSYIHNNSKIGVLVRFSPEIPVNADTQFLANDIAMHIAATNPQFITREDVGLYEKNREMEIAREKALNAGKKPEFLDKIVGGALEKYYRDVCLMEQSFIKEPKMTVADILKPYGAVIVDFHRYEI